MSRWLDSPPSARDLPPLTGLRGYLTACALLAVLLGPDLVKRIAVGAHLAGAPAWVTWPRHWPAAAIYGAVLTATAVWLLALEGRRARRADPDGCRPVLPTAAAGGVGLLGVALCALTGTGRGQTWADIIGVVAVAGAGVWLCLGVARDRGISAAQMGIAPPWAADRPGRIQAVTIAAISLSACVIGTKLLIPHQMSLPVPTMTTSQADLLGGTDLSFRVMGLAAGFREETVFVAATAVMLTAAGRPLRELYAVSMTARILWHAYIGVPALGVALFAVANLWLFTRTRRLTPLITVHLAYNALLDYWPQGLTYVLVLLILAALLLQADARPAHRSGKTP
ncbi:CPBP family glutamic-type intramembrane protease [Actinomadura litoris]|uniref:CPBP family glutamic-type intramembrane protease n=1 Tax=Actinomadura litoris TaxID=2678616 RepID=UPI001562F3B5|nr:CPBP family glutamic-type intramembrane protease [Actinomadura litoris]